MVHLSKKLKKKFSGYKMRLVRFLSTSNGFVLHAFYREGKAEKGPVRKVFYLFFLWIASMIGGGIRGHRVSAAKRKNYTRGPFVDKPETRHYKRPSFPFLAKKILVHDIISFDVFDTLLLRPFDDPKSVFYLVGEQLKCPGFYRYRVLAEKQARAKNLAQNDSNEVTLVEIYEQLQRYFIVDPQKAARIEAKIEWELALAHPYVKQIYSMAKNMGKTVIAVTDMYLPKEDIEKMLQKCGYDMDNIFVSNAYGISKRRGGLYEKVKEAYPDKRILHIGDNFTADVKMARENQIEAVFMRNVNTLGNPHRAFDMTALVGSAYRGILNNKLCSGMEKLNQYYEYGYSYAGLFVLGYCHFIHEKAKHEKIDKILFLSRDGDILKQAYSKLYPNAQTEYVYWSRAAATDLTTGRFRNEYLLRYIKYKISRKYTLAQILASMRLPEMLPHLEAAGFSAETVVTAEIYEELVACFIKHWDLVEAHCLKSEQAAQQYYREKIGDAKKVCVVDVGWAASGFSALRYLIEDRWQIGCEVTGAVAGANYLHDQNIIEAPLLNGKMDAYFFSQRKNRDLKQNHHVGRLYSVFIEMMLASPTPSFTGFSYDDNGEVAFSFDLPETEGYGYIKDIQQGILDFIADYTKAFAKYPYLCNISGADAYEACRFVIARIRYFKRLFGDYPVNRAVGSNGYAMETLKDLIEREYAG